MEILRRDFCSSDIVGIPFPSEILSQLFQVLDPSQRYCSIASFDIAGSLLLLDYLII